jgi:hypothetical protein
MVRMSASDLPPARIRRACLIFAREIARGRPPNRPCARAAANPSDRRHRTLFVPYSLRSHENCPAEGLPRRSRALPSLLTPETAKKRGGGRKTDPGTSSEGQQQL